MFQKFAKNHQTLLKLYKNKVTRALLVAVGVGLTLAKGFGSEGAAQRCHQASTARFNILTKESAVSTVPDVKY